MDPALWELLRAEAGTDGSRVIEAIIRLARPGIEIPDVRMVSRFGTVATCRIRARDVVPVRARRDVVSLKAARGLSPGWEPAADPVSAAASSEADVRPTDIRRSPGLALTGKGVVVASVDWGVDVDCAAFRWPADPGAAGAGEPGGTRFLSFWDQRDLTAGPSPQPYGYGTVHDREDIDDALQQPRPYGLLGYHPAIADPAGRGSHGTHVLDIAAGNGQAGGPVGIAPEADLIFVHLADRRTGGLGSFGDSVRLLEAVDFISRTAGPQPCVINISAGRTCGPKDGTTLVERALDELLATTPGRFVVNSAGNYFGWRTHACGTIRPGEERSLTFVTGPSDITLNELEIWYDGADEFAIRIDPPGSAAGPTVRLGERSDLIIEGRTAGRVYHRKHDPNNCDNHFVAYIDPVGRPGNWTVTLQASRVTSGRFHAWIERDDACHGCQARFTSSDSNPFTTIGTITTSRIPLIVGAYDGHDPARPAAPFSSSGPSRDLRLKPDLAAPGVDVLAARSASIIDTRNRGLLVRKSGTSMATPHVTGAIALCLEAAGSRLSARQIRTLVLTSCDPGPDADARYRLGRGYLDIPRLVNGLRQALTAPADPPTRKDATVGTVMLLSAAPATAYREYLYRPRGQLARSIGDRFQVVGTPGRRFDRMPQRGDMLIEIALGRPGGGRCVILDGPALEDIRSRPSLPAGQLILRPRRQVKMSGVLPAEPASGEDEPGRPTVAPFRVATVPAAAQQAFGKGSTSWREAVAAAIGAGVSDPRILADLMFFMRHPERMSAGIGKLIEETEPGFYKLQADWTLCFTIVARILNPTARPTVFLPARPSPDYENFVAAPTTGRITLMVHGRNWDGSGHVDPGTGQPDGFRDELETFNRMQQSVESLSADDSLFIANWQFRPADLRLTAGVPRPGMRTWADLLASKARDGVKIRVIIAQQPAFSPFMTDLAPLDAVIGMLPADKRDNFTYIVSPHPDAAGSHHQKFMVARKGDATIAFCGGLDISVVRAPPGWGTDFAWHDVGAKVEGLIAHDLEREFAARWNREKDKSTARPLAGWKAFENLVPRGASEADKAAALNPHRVQMLRTVAVSPDTAGIRRDDIWRGYFRLIGRATRFIYLENQYFYTPELADAIVRQAEAQPGLIVIVMAGTGTDDREAVDPKAVLLEAAKQRAQVDIIQNQFALRLEFFRRLSAAPLGPGRLRVYTLNYPGGILHSKLILVDDQALSVGSANANPRGFFFDTELNLMLDHADAVKSFRQRLWAHNLGLAPGTVATWTPAEFFDRWDAVAQANQRVQAQPARMTGEGVIPFRPLDNGDPRFRPGKRGPIHLPFGKTIDPPENLF